MIFGQSVKSILVASAIAVVAVAVAKRVPFTAKYL